MLFLPKANKDKDLLASDEPFVPQVLINLKTVEKACLGPFLSHQRPHCGLGCSPWFWGYAFCQLSGKAC
jgi:hypothetical protein